MSSTLAKNGVDKVIQITHNAPAIEGIAEQRTMSRRGEYVERTRLRYVRKNDGILADAGRPTAAAIASLHAATAPLTAKQRG